MSRFKLNKLDIRQLIFVNSKLCINSYILIGLPKTTKKLEIYLSLVGSTLPDKFKLIKYIQINKTIKQRNINYLIDKNINNKDTIYTPKSIDKLKPHYVYVVYTYKEKLDKYTYKEATIAGRDIKAKLKLN